MVTVHVPVVTNCCSTVRLHHMRDVSAEGRPVAPSGLSQQLAAWNGPQTGGSGVDEHIKRTVAIEGVL